MNRGSLSASLGYETGESVATKAAGYHRVLPALGARRCTPVGLLLFNEHVASCFDRGLNSMKKPADIIEPKAAFGLGLSIFQRAPLRAPKPVLFAEVFLEAFFPARLCVVLIAAPVLSDLLQKLGVRDSGEHDAALGLGVFPASRRTERSFYELHSGIRGWRFGC